MNSAQACFGTAAGPGLSIENDGLAMRTTRVQDVGMKLVAALAVILLAATGCEKNPSKLDGMAEKQLPGAAPVSGDLEARVARLERYGEALDFLQKVYEQQKQQQAQQEESEPAPDAVFAVDIAPNLQLGQIEGPAQAAVTIVEAWDFA
jgi:hypothetical protein